MWFDKIGIKVSEASAGQMMVAAGSPKFLVPISTLHDFTFHKKINLRLAAVRTHHVIKLRCTAFPHKPFNYFPRILNTAQPRAQTPHCSTLHEKQAVYQLIKKFHMFHRTLS